MLGSDAELVQLFFEECNRQLEAQLAGMQSELEGMEIRWEQAAWLAEALNETGFHLSCSFRAAARGDSAHAHAPRLTLPACLPAGLQGAHQDRAAAEATHA